MTDSSGSKYTRPAGRASQPLLLIVDDETLTRDWLADMFSEAGFAVETAAHGLEALERAAAHPPDLLLTDLLMPRMDGFELIRHWRGDPMLRGIPIVVHTVAGGEREDAVYFTSLDVDCVIGKGLSPEDLVLRVDETLERVRLHPRPPLDTSAGSEVSHEDADSVEAGHRDRLRRLLHDADTGLASSALHRQLLSEVGHLALSEIDEATLLREAGQLLDHLLQLHTGAFLHVHGERQYTLLHRWGNGDAEAPLRMDAASADADLSDCALCLPVRSAPETLPSLVLEVHRNQGFDDNEPILLQVLTGIIATGIAARRASAQLRHSEARFRATFEQAAIGLAHLSPDGRILRANRCLAQMLERRAEDLQGLELVELTHPEDRDQERAHLQRLLENDQATPPHWDKRLLAVNDRAFWVRQTASIVRDVDRTPRYLVLAVDDIGEQRRTEAMLGQNLKIEALGRLAGGIAHDFNNLLTVILYYAREAGSWYPEDSPRREDIHEIIRAAERATALTGQLLSFSRRSPAPTLPLRLDLAISELERMLNRLIGADIEMTLVPAGEPLWVLADPSQLEQVLMNLVLNARDAMPDGGRITIRLEARRLLPGRKDAEVPALEAGDWAVLEVADTGCGFDETVRERLFEPFFSTKGENGTGLGLPTTYTIVHDWGGDIAVQSWPGRGSSFRVWLPRCSREAATTGLRVIAPEPASGDGRRVLLVEDEAPLRKLAGRILERAGYQVEDFDGPATALARVAAGGPPPDVILTDVVMPGMNGRVMVEQLRATWPDIPVAYMSGYTEDEILNRGIIADNETLLHKPFSAGDLLATLDRLLQHHRRSAAGKPA